MPLPLTVSCSSKIQIGFTFLVPAHLGSPGHRAVKRVCVCVCVCILWHFVYLLELLSVNSVKRQTTVIHLSFVDSQTVCSVPKILLIGYHVICFYLMVQIFGVFLQENCSDLRPDEAAWHVCRLDPSVFYSWWGQCHSPCMHIITTSILTAVFRWTSVSWVSLVFFLHFFWKRTFGDKYHVSDSLLSLIVQSLRVL